jgi:hypothetical protein
VTAALQRTVLVLGPRIAEPVQLYPVDVEGSMSLVVIVVGWPLTEPQQQALEACRELAKETGIVFDALLVGSVPTGLEEISMRDRVLLGADRRDARRIARALSARKITARVAR